ncbi:CAP domain-containing protein [Pseudanabaenaceae cyanobacterium LEGE 13415]|nr:CAP domain-containing protein [Pseudanabaenaceae cyanobacterium LEGE 13415]
MFNHRAVAQVAPTFEASILSEINQIQATPQAYIEKAIVEETNRLRSNPQAYAAELAELRQYFNGNILRVPGSPAIETQEGIAAVDEAIRDLKATLPLPSLTLSQGMSLGARDHVLDLGPKGKAGHYGTDGSDPFQRINRYGTWQGSAGENISFSPIATARWHVMQLVIDDGVRNRGHRKALLNPDYRLMGSACGNHTVYGQMCVMTYSKDYTEGNVQGRR